jgi:hypothetical protein
VLGSLGLASAARPAAAAWASGTRAALLSTLAEGSILNQLKFKEMGMLSWLVVDLAINWGGWALATLLKVCADQLFARPLSARLPSSTWAPPWLGTAALAG